MYLLKKCIVISVIVAHVGGKYNSHNINNI